MRGEPRFRSVARMLMVGLDRCEPAIEWTIRACGWSSILFVFAIFVFVFLEGAPMLFGDLNLVEFFTSPNWRPDSLIKPQYGILALLAGTVSVTLLAMVISVPLGLGAAMYVSEFAGTRRHKQDRHRCHETVTRGRRAGSLPGTQPLIARTGRTRSN